MKQKFRIDFSMGQRRFEKLRSYSAAGFSVSEELFEVVLDKRTATARMRTLMACILQRPTCFAVRFCGVEEMRQTNLRYRKKNKPTDVLTFCREPGVPSLGVDELGDILVCLPVCLAQAQRARVSLSTEVERMIVHGLAHLLGFDHERSEMAFEIQNGLEKSMRAELFRRLGTPKWCELRNK